MSQVPAPQLADAAQLAELRDRLARRRAPAADPGDADWRRGVPAGWLEELLADWTAFDPAELQARIDALEHHQVLIEDQPLHVCLAPGRGERPLPIVLTNGWPSSFLEYLDLVPLLTAPATTSASPDAPDCFSVVIPALPGFGFSPAPTGGPRGAREVAGLWNTLMTDVLGHARYVAHGTDLGWGVTAWLGRDHASSVDAIHLASPHLPVPRDPHGPEEQRFATELRAWFSDEGAYAHMHSTKPGTLATALSDSPAGLAAWIGEKFTAWSPAGDPDQDAALRRLLLGTLTLYWTTNTISTSFWPYWAGSHGAAIVPIDDPSPVRTAIDLFGGERAAFPRPPRSLGERYFTISDWGEHPDGGHFPAAAAPAQLAAALRHAFTVS